MDYPEITRAQGHYLYDGDDRAFYDLISGFGTVFLGHCDKAVVEAVHQQMQQYK